MKDICIYLNPLTDLQVVAPYFLLVSNRVGYPDAVYCSLGLVTGTITNTLANLKVPGGGRSALEVCICKSNSLRSFLYCAIMMTVIIK